MKRKSMVVIFTLILTLFLVTPVVLGAAPDSSTLTLLHMNENSGTIAYDSSVNGNDGIVIGASWTNDGKFDSALVFDGAYDYILMQPGFSDIPQGTIEMWVRPNININGPTGNQQFFFMKGKTPASTGAHQFIIDTNGQLSYLKWDGDWKWAYSEGLTWEAGQWYHIAATWGPQGMHIFRDGNEVGSNPYTGAGVYNAYIQASIGNWNYQAGHEFYRGFNGTIDEFRLSSIQRTYENNPPGWDGSIPPGLDKKDKTPPGFDEGNKTGWE